MTRLAIIVMVAAVVGCVSVRPAPSSSAKPGVAPKTVIPVPTAKPITSSDTAPLPGQVVMAFATDSAAINDIVDEGMNGSHIAADIEYLSDVIGPRLTGSAALRRANEWTKGKFKEYGVDSAWTESWTFGRGWQRGPINVELLAPHRQQLFAASWAWTPGTSGPETGTVEMVDASTAEEFVRRYAGGTLRGKWIMPWPPSWVHNFDFGPMMHVDSLQLDSVYRQAATMTNAQRQYRGELPWLLAHEGALGILTDGAKEDGLLTMSGSPIQPYPLPNIVLPHEDYSMFSRLLAAGDSVTLRADITNTLTVDTLRAENTIAEIRGSEHPEQVVLLGAHLDSWDLATGATDNGAGAIAVLEAARLLAAAKVRPARTIRFVLFSGEEEGLLGSAAYAKAHAAELGQYQVVMVLDNGTGRITGIALQGRRELHDTWARMFAAIAQLGPFDIRSANKGGTDHLSFVPYSVPVFNYDQVTLGYNHTHHSQVDTFDHVSASDLAQAATVMAVNAYQWASTDTLLARVPAQ